MSQRAVSTRPAVRVLLVWLLLESIAALQVYRADGSTVLFHWVRTVVRPVTWVADVAVFAASDLVAGLTDVRRLAGDNEVLRRELERARLENTILTTDLSATREALEVALATPMTSFQIGRILYRDLSRGLLVVSVPASADILRNAAVVAADGLVGRVIRIEADRCWIESLATPGAAVAVQTPDGGAHGIAEGIGRGRLRVQYLGRQTTVTRGDVLSTSGADGLYPPDIPVARVVSVEESSAPFLSMTASPAVDVGDVRAVAILTGIRPVAGQLEQ
jgi:rod shape-determining protein MreC